RCMEEDIPIILCSQAGYYASEILPESPSRRERLRAHIRAWDAMGEEGRLDVARALIWAKITACAECYAALDSGGSLGRDAGSALSAVQAAEHYTALLGAEGRFAKTCFPLVNAGLPEPFLSEARLPGQKADRWNCLLDGISSLMFNHLCMTLRAEGLDPFLGFLHRQYMRYETLAADLQELFRPELDMLLRAFVLEGGAAVEDFEQKGESFRLSGELRKRLIAEFERWLSTPGPDGTARRNLIDELVRRLRRFLCQGKSLSLLVCGRWRRASACALNG
ncbi:MAG: CRISPR-associated endonuclease Cas1, partial [Desulfovibrionaceae bacterium]|nr:CRISPR-associated endonuclease Cas1 [Desulfovibrionaceae bacterium]